MSERDQFERNCHELAAHMHNKTADGLERLMNRLGPEGLGDEWNAVVEAKSNERIEAWRRSRAAQAIESTGIQEEEG